MNEDMMLVSIPEKEYSDYRYEVIFKAYKWDPQVGDNNTIARHAILIKQETANLLGRLAEQLSQETMLMEEALINRTDCAKELGLPPKIMKAMPLLSGYRRDRNVRLMRFDFHYTKTGWMISEVNSDVPGGLAEASVLPGIACRYIAGGMPGKNTADVMIEAFKAKAVTQGRIAFVHATSYADDRQVMQFLGDCFDANGFSSVYAAPDQITWNNCEAVCIVEGQEGKVDAIMRFFPLEWLANLPRNVKWQRYFDSEVLCCNHPAAMLTQSKRLPLVWDKLGIDLPAWKSLLPETVDPKAVRRELDGWIYKPALGRVGGGISIKGAITEKERKAIEKSARRFPNDWVAQRMFQSIPVHAPDSNNGYHICIGVFTVDGKSAGFYARMSELARIDENAQDVPVLIVKE
jgi:Glutathionylspermidine synthase